MLVSESVFRQHYHAFFDASHATQPGVWCGEPLQDARRFRSSLILQLVQSRVAIGTLLRIMSHPKVKIILHGLHYVAQLRIFSYDASIRQLLYHCSAWFACDPSNLVDCTAASTGFPPLSFHTAYSCGYCRPMNPGPIRFNK